MSLVERALPLARIIRSGIGTPTSPTCAYRLRIKRPASRSPDGQREAQRVWVLGRRDMRARGQWSLAPVVTIRQSLASLLPSALLLAACGSGDDQIDPCLALEEIKNRSRISAAGSYALAGGESITAQIRMSTFLRVTLAMVGTKKAPGR